MALQICLYEILQKQILRMPSKKDKITFYPQKLYWRFWDHVHEWYSGEIHDCLRVETYLWTFWDRQKTASHWMCSMQILEGKHGHWSVILLAFSTKEWCCSIFKKPTAILIGTHHLPIMLSIAQADMSVNITCNSHNSSVRPYQTVMRHSLTLTIYHPQTSWCAPLR